ncbi:MAG: hypothetical protein ACFB4J_00795 [Elainellaceae cyanobacterium]
MDWRHRGRKTGGRTQNAKQTLEAGLTLVECLVSLFTVTLLGALVGPPLLWASAAQLQAQRVQQAQRLAQAEVDRVRLQMGQADARSDVELSNLELPPVTTANQLTQQPAPQAIAALRSTHEHCPTSGNPGQAHEAIGIDLDGDADCDAEFMVQAFRTGNEAVESQATFELMVRVYAFKGDFEGLQTAMAPVGLGQTAARRPLAVTTTLLTLGGTSETLLCYHRRPCGQSGQ